MAALPSQTHPLGDGPLRLIIPSELVVAFLCTEAGLIAHAGCGASI